MFIKNRLSLSVALLTAVGVSKTYAQDDTGEASEQLGDNAVLEEVIVSARP